MKNTLFRRIGFTAIYCLFALMATTFCNSPTARAQTSRVPVFTTSEIYSQMWQPNKTYFNSVISASGSTYNVGSQIDTIATATTTYFAICKYQTPAVVNNDSFYYTPLSGEGIISFAWNATKISGTVAGSVKLEQSDDGISWQAKPKGEVAGDTTFTLTDVAAQGTRINLPYKHGRYWRWAVTSTGTLSFTFRGSYYFQRRQEIALAK